MLRATRQPLPLASEAYTERKPTLKGAFVAAGLLLPHPSFHPAGPAFALRLAPMGSPAVHPALEEDVGLISEAGGHTEDITVTCGHILFSRCTRALFLLNSQSFIDSKPLPFSPTPSTLYFYAMYPLSHPSTTRPLPL